MDNVTLSQFLNNTYNKNARGGPFKKTSKHCKYIFSGWQRISNRKDQTKDSGKQQKGKVKKNKTAAGGSTIEEGKIGPAGMPHDFQHSLEMHKSSEEKKKKKESGKYLGR